MNDVERNYSKMWSLFQGLFGPKFSWKWESITLSEGRDKKMKKNKYGYLAAVIMSLLFISSLAQAGTVDLPQTGQAKCYNSSGTEISCTDTGQDGDIRAGVAWPAPRFMNNGDGTVTDNLTGLIWTQDAGTPTVGSCTGGYTTWQNALNYVTCLNSMNYLGYSDWHLPNINELESLINAGEPNPATWLNSQGFTNVQSSRYWSSSSHAFDKDGAWIVYMWHGGFGSGNKGGIGGYFYVWPVRSGQSTAPAQIWKTGQTKCYNLSGTEISCAGTGQDGDILAGVPWPDPRFTDHGDGTVTDNLTGLIWAQDAGTPGPSACAPGTNKTWQGALDYADCLNANSYLGYTDWRVPNQKELRSLADYGRYAPALPANHPFSYSTISSDYWSSSTDANNTNSAWYVGMWDGDVGYYNKTEYHYYFVWPVRSGQSGSFGLLDHFDFDPISSPQAVDTPFNMKITAKNSGGQKVTTFSGDVILSPSIGQISQTKAHLTNGEGTLSVTLDSAGGNIRIQGSGGGKSGQSNPFDVTGAVADQAYIGGIVTDGAGNRIAGATVDLNDGINPMSATTDSNGSYLFANIPPGAYSIKASDSFRQSSAFLVNLSNYQCRTLDLVLLGSICNPTGLTPILLVPGILGSSTEDDLYPGLPEVSPAWDDPCWLISGVHVKNGLLDPTPFPPFLQYLAGWNDLVNSIKSVNAEYEVFCNIFPVPYDWRKDIDDVARDYLKPWIDKAKNLSGMPKVNIIAHSMGGLVTRAYIQGGDYDDDIDKFAMVGTPNHGAANAYYIWEGGDPKLADDLNEPWYKGMINFYSNTFDKLYKEMHSNEPFTLLFPSAANSTPPAIIEQDKPDPVEVRNFLHDHVPSVRQLLPTYWFLRYNLALKGITDPESINTTLIDLNGNPDLEEVTVKIFAGRDEKTIDNIIVGVPNNLYKDGAPMGTPQTVTSGDASGDGTVLISSATLGSVLTDSSLQGEHSGLIKTYKEDIVEFITGIKPPALAPKTTTDKARQAVVNGLLISVRGRVQPYVTDPLVRKSGINPTTNQREDEIPGGTISMDLDGGSISIENPADGTYTLNLKNAYAEDYRLILSYMDDVTNVRNEYLGFNHANTITFTFSVDSASTNKLVFDHTPLAPTGLQADPVDSGGLKTKLTWNAATDPDVAGYNIYSRGKDEPSLAQIGITTDTFFDTGDPWAENASIPTRLYAISAVKGDGTESFLSNMVTNDDRDHDGLSDEKEVLYGTDMTKPDTDGDGLTDSQEIVRGTNPLLTDTDGDTYSDYDEVKAASDPLDSSSLPTPCNSSTDCGTEFYCAKPDGQCGDAGICEYKPGACDPIDDPVCGCDGVTYENTCQASLAGASVNYNGACDTDGDSIPDDQDNCPQIANSKQQDKDSDGVGNVCDNCTLVANPSQCDANGDGYGNICDPDLDNNGLVETRDSRLFREVFGTSDPDADFDCNGLVETRDSRILKKYMGKPPGPSCIDTNPACKN